MKIRALPKIYLLRNKIDFENVYRQGKRVHGENFSLILLPNNANHNRLGISIHGQLKGAAKRNRIKRIIREYFRLNKHFPQEKSSKSCRLPCMDIVLTVRKGFSLDSPAAVAGAVDRLFEHHMPLWRQIP